MRDPRRGFRSTSQRHSVRARSATKWAGLERTNPPGSFVGNHVAPLAADELGVGERGRGEVREDVREDFGWEVVDRCCAGCESQLLFVTVGESGKGRAALLSS